MSRHATDVQESVQESVQECVVSPPLPADHVLDSGAVLFPGAFDQHGCPLVVFPLDEQVQLSQLSKAEVVDFINHFLCLHNKKQEKESLVSVVADLRHASLPTIRFIAETLLLLELHKQTVHSVYILQPETKDAVKLLLKLLAPSKSHTASFKKVFLKEISELSNYIDRSQLTTQLGGYFIYCHQSWVAFIKDIDAFDKEFLSVVQRLPKCISTLHALSRLPLPSTFNELQNFCSTNEAKFQQFRRELGLDELLRHCELVVEKLRYPEKEPCYQAMAGTALFTRTAFDMLQNHSRIAAAVEKVELLWQQAFSKARLQLQVLQLREDALQITEQITTLHREKLQSYKIEIAKDASRAAILVFEFETSIHTPAMALVRCAEDVIHTLAEILPFDGQTREHWVLDLERLKEKLCSAVNFIHQNLRAVSKYHRNYNKACSWYNLVLCESFFQDLLSGVDGESASTRRQRRSSGMIPAWRHKIYAFLKKNPPPDMEELIHLAHLSNVIPDDEVQLAGRQMSDRCQTLRKLLISSGPVSVGHLQLALQWQYDLLRSNHVNHSSAVTSTNSAAKDATKCEPVSGMVSAEGKPPSLRSFDSGYDGAASSQLEAWGGRAGLEGLSTPTVTTDSVRRVLSQPQIYKENICSVSDSEDHRVEFDAGSVGNSSRASIQIIPKITVEALNFEIRVRRSAAPQSNPWLSLPVDDLDNSYTVTITQNPTLQKRDLRFHHTPDPCTTANHSNWSPDQLTQTEVLNSTWSRPPQSKDWMPHSQSTFEDPELSPICNILSSTITDGRDKSICTTEGIPTLLWDSYDLHEQKEDSVDSLIDVSLEDWDVKEQEELKEVEKILDRADEILEKEENVLAQEAELDALLRSEDQQIPWLWDSEDQHGVMSSSELAEAGVLGLEDNLSPAESDNLSEPGSAAIETDTKGSDQCTEAAAGTDTIAFQSRLDVLTELREVHILDELIMEENLKIHLLRYSKGKPSERLSGTKPSDSNRQSSTSKERETFRLQLEKEKREVDKLEKSLGEECIVKKHKDSARKVVKCFKMEKARNENKEDRVLCDEVLSGSSNTSLSTDSMFSVNNISQAQDKPKHIPAVLGPDVAKASLPQDLIPISHCQDNCETELSIFNRTASSSTSDLKGPPEEVEIQPQVLKELDRSTANATICKPVASLNPETRPDDGAFDPGGKSHCCPLPKPRKALLPLNNELIEEETPTSTELQISDLSSVTQHPGVVQLNVQNKALDVLPQNVTSATSHNLVLNANVKEHSNNNNNKHAPVHYLSETTKREKDTSDLRPCLLQTDLPPAEETQTVAPVDDSPHQQFAPQLPPEQPLRCDPSGTDEQNEDLPEECSEAMRITGCGSPGIEAQLNISMCATTDFKTPIVLDTGSGLMKAGFADQDLPNVIFPTIIGMPKYEEIMNGDIERDTYIGHQAQHMRGVLTLKHPIKNGIIRNWDDMEKIWHHTFQQLCVDPEDHPVLLTEAAMNPTENRQRMVEIMFECFSVPFTYVAMQAVLALYAAGRITGVVLDSGDGVSHSVPVFEGYCLPHAVQRFPLAGVDVTMHLKTLLQEQGVSMCTTAEMEIVREMKEKCCFVALNYETELSLGGTSCREMHYTMPDGQIVTLSTERFRAPEILFKPELIGRDHYGMHESIFKSVLSSDIDLRRCFLGNIVLSGGNTLMTGLPERLQAEIRGLVPTDMGESVRVTSPKDRDFLVWSGGAVLASQPTFTSAWISHEEYEEHGPQIVLRKCF